MTTRRDEEFRSYVLTRRGELLRSATLLAAGDRYLAEDLVQSTLTKLYIAWSTFQRADNPNAYAQRALINALVDEKRRAWRRYEHSCAELLERPSQHTEGNSRTDEVWQALGDLPPRMRAAVVLRYFHDLSVAETADVLGCEQGTVKSQTARALDRLRSILSPTPVDSRCA